MEQARAWQSGAQLSLPLRQKDKATKPHQDKATKLAELLKPKLPESQSELAAIHIWEVYTSTLFPAEPGKCSSRQSLAKHPGPCQSQLLLPARQGERERQHRDPAPKYPRCVPGSRSQGPFEGLKQWKPALPGDKAARELLLRMTRAALMKTLRCLVKAI